MVSAARGPNTNAASSASGWFGVALVEDRSITPPVPSLASSGITSAEPGSALAIWLSRHGHGLKDAALVVALTGHHHFPGDAGGLVRQRHGGELGLLPFE